MSIFGARTAAARSARCLNQSELARACGTQPSRINNLERGRFGPSVEFAVTLADVLGVSLDYLTGRTDGDESMQRRAEILAQIEELKAQLA